VPGEQGLIPLLLNAAPSGIELTRATMLRVMGERPIDEFDPGRSAPDQFLGRRAVIDLGGWGRREHTAAAVDGGVELWHVLGYGLDHLDLQYLLANGVQVAHTPGSCSAVALAEHAMLLLLATVRSIKEQMDNLQKGRFYYPWSEELAGRRLHLVGVGASGLELARRASSFGMEVVGVDVAIGDATIYRRAGVERVELAERLHDLMATADVVSLHLPLSAMTYHVIDEVALSAIKPGAVILNVARGALIDERALLRALDDGRVSGAGIDVFEQEPPTFNSELADHPRVVATPHTAGATTQTVERRAKLVADNLLRLERSQPIEHTVTFEDDFLTVDPTE
jgi:D-3-phosphoglycerate dehydrogenase